MWHSNQHIIEMPKNLFIKDVFLLIDGQYMFEYDDKKTNNTT